MPDTSVLGTQRAILLVCVFMLGVMLPSCGQGVPLVQLRLSHGATPARSWTLHNRDQLH